MIILWFYTASVYYAMHYYTVLLSDVHFNKIDAKINFSIIVFTFDNLPTQFLIRMLINHHYRTLASYCAKTYVPHILNN